MRAGMALFSEQTRIIIIKFKASKGSGENAMRLNNGFVVERRNLNFWGEIDGGMLVCAANLIHGSLYGGELLARRQTGDKVLQTQ